MRTTVCTYMRYNVVVMYDISVGLSVDDIFTIRMLHVFMTY